MEIILIDNVKNVGKLGEVAKVSGGYARNYLIPYGKAIPATSANLEVFEKKRSELEKKSQERLLEAQKRAENLEGLSLVHEAMASDEGKLYGSVPVQEIAQLIQSAGFEVARSKILIGQPIREVGTYDIKLQIHPEVCVSIHLKVQAPVTSTDA